MGADSCADHPVKLYIKKLHLHWFITNKNVAYNLERAKGIPRHQLGWGKI